MIVEKSNAGVYRIVDGQQRTTSLMLLLKALHDHADSEHRDKLRMLTHQTPGNEEGTLGLRLQPQASDLPSFHAVMADSSLPEQPAGNNRQFAQNYGLFSKLVKQRPLTTADVEDALDRMHLTFIELDRKQPDHDKPQTIFEKMNAEGKNLEVHDLIRNYVFLLAAESRETSVASASAKQRSLYLNEWRNFENEFPERAFGQMKHFFRDYLVIKTGVLNPGSGPGLYGKFKEYLRKDYPGTPFPGGSPLARFSAVESLANDIWKHASAWTKVVFGKKINDARDQPKELQKQIKDFGLIGHDPFYPFATLLLVHGQSDPKLHGNLAAVFKMLNRFLAVSELTHTHIEFQQELVQPFVGSPERVGALKKLLADPAVFRAKLLTLWPANFDAATELRRSLLGEPQEEPGMENEEEDFALEAGSTAQTNDVAPPVDGDKPGSVVLLPPDTPPDVYRRATAYLLLRINEDLMRNANDTKIEYIEPDHTLEHIMPRSTDTQKGWSDVDPGFYCSHINSLGNFTLAGRGFNAALSNRPLTQKLSYYANSSYVLTRQLAGELKAAGVIKNTQTSTIDWDKFARYLQQRAQALANHAVEALQF